MNKATNFQDLIVWQKAHQLVLLIYFMTKLFPDSEKFGLISQIRRAGVSIAANIAEGFKKQGKADKLNFINIAQGSLEEVRYYFILAGDLGYLKDKSMPTLLDEVGKLLAAYRIGIQNKYQ